MFIAVRRFVFSLCRLLSGGRWPFRSLDPDDDPFAWKPAPRKHGPRDRSAAVALAEPDED